MAWLVMNELGLTASLEVNSLGCPKCRPDFNKALLEFLDKAEGLCDDCLRRREKNPLRVLDCKSVHCQEQYEQAPSILDFLCDDCNTHFKAVEEGLGLLEIPYKVNSFMVRGLDYYTRTTFELVTDALGAQSAVGAGGRYDGLVKQLGGPQVPGIGFAMGMERLALLLEQQENRVFERTVDLFVAALGQRAQKKGFALTHALRKAGHAVIMDHQDRSLKNQMKQAGRAKARFALILGEDELDRGEAVLRNMDNREQQGVAVAGDMAAQVAGLIR